MKRNITIFGAIFLFAAASFAGYMAWKYQKADVMEIAVEEVSPAEYPEDPSHRSVNYSKYGHRSLRLVQLDDTHFDFVFESEDPAVATVSFKNIDVGLFIPTLPEWVKGDESLEIIALVDQEWNRQQVRFNPHSEHIEISGGDGFEEDHINSLELARNCLNAGLWEVMLYTREGGKKALYYQGWFTFPLGHYKEIFEKKNDVSYWSHWYRLEHWCDPEGTKLDLNQLRTVIDEEEIETQYSPNEKIVVAGEQERKTRTFDAKDVRCWGDFCEKKPIKYASFIPPGRYSVAHPWNHEYERIAKLEKTIVRTIQTPTSDEKFHEVELVFRSSRTGKLQRFIVSGIHFQALPMLPRNEYPKGLYMPMGIGVNPFYQTYKELKQTSAHESPYFSLLLDEDGRWINHHKVAIDGPVMHRDMETPNNTHLYLLSYERHSLVGHFNLQTSK